MTKSELLEALHAIESTDADDLEVILHVDDYDYELVSVYLGEDGKIILSEDEGEDENGEEATNVIDADFRKVG
jgi:hypothetical protein